MTINVANPTPEIPAQPDAVVMPPPKLSAAPAPVQPADAAAPTYSRSDALAHGQALLDAGVAPDVVIAALAKDGHIVQLEDRAPQAQIDERAADSIAPAKSEYDLGHLAAYSERLGGSIESVAAFTQEARVFATELALPPALASALFDRVLETAATYDSKDEEGREQWAEGEKQAIATIAHRYGGVDKMAALVEAALNKGSPAFRAKLEKSNTLKDRYTYAMLAGQGMALDVASRLRGGRP